MKISGSCRYYRCLVNQGEWWCDRQFDKDSFFEKLSQEDYEIIMNCDCEHCSYKVPLIFWQEVSEI